MADTGTDGGRFTAQLDSLPLDLWSEDHVIAWLRSLSFLFGEYGASFRREQVTGRKLRGMTRHNMTSTLGISNTDARFISLKLSSLVRKQGNQPLSEAEMAAAAAALAKQEAKIEEPPTPDARPLPVPSAHERTASTVVMETAPPLPPIDETLLGYVSKKAVVTWSVDDVCVWLSSLSSASPGFTEDGYIKIFRANEVDGATLVDLSADDLVSDLSMSVDAANHCVLALRKLQKEREPSMLGLASPDAVAAMKAVAAAASAAAAGQSSEIREPDDNTTDPVAFAVTVSPPSAQSSSEMRAEAPEEKKPNISVSAVGGSGARVPVPDPQAKSPALWSVEEVCAWVQSLSFLFDEYVAVFREHQIDGPALLTLTAPRLQEELGLSATAARFAVAKMGSMRRGLGKDASLDALSPASSSGGKALKRLESAPVASFIDDEDDTSKEKPHQRATSVTSHDAGGIPVPDRVKAAVARVTGVKIDLSQPLEEWTCDQVCAWLCQLSWVFNEYIPTLLEIGVDGSTMLDITSEELQGEIEMNQTAAQYAIAKLEELKGQQAKQRSKAMAERVSPQKQAKGKSASGGTGDSDVDEALNDPCGPVDEKEKAIWGEWTFDEQNNDSPDPFMVKGMRMLKYGRFGKPKAKFVCVSDKRKTILWGPSPEETYIKRERLRDQRSSASELSLEEVIELRVGKHTKVLQRKIAREAPFEHCFSLVFPNRTLDFECENVKMAARWVRALELWLGPSVKTG